MFLSFVVERIITNRMEVLAVITINNSILSAIRKHDAIKTDSAFSAKIARTFSHPTTSATSFKNKRIRNRENPRSTVNNVPNRITVTLVSCAVLFFSLRYHNNTHRSCHNNGRDQYTIRRTRVSNTYG